MEVTELGDEAVDDAMTRLRKVEGQVRGIQRMIDEGRDCEDVLRQIAAASKALRRAGVRLAVQGLEHCVTTSGKEASAFERAFLELA